MSRRKPKLIWIALCVWPVVAAVGCTRLKAGSDRLNVDCSDATGDSAAFGSDCEFWPEEPSSGGTGALSTAVMRSTGDAADGGAVASTDDRDRSEGQEAGSSAMADRSNGGAGSAGSGSVRGSAGSRAAGAGSNGRAGAGSAGAGSAGAGSTGAGSAGAGSTDNAGMTGMAAAGSAGTNVAGAAGGGTAGMLAAAGGGAGAAGSAPDPCTIDHGGCDVLATCVESHGAARCGICPPGYRDEKSDGTHCKEIDECLAQTSECAAHSTCKNTPGSYDCPCDAGYNGDGHHACLVNQLCNADASNCAALASCKDREGTKYCICGAGYDGDGVTCADVDECLTNNGGCGTASFWKCVNQPGAAPTCYDIDECLTNNGGCGSASFWKCVNQPGAVPTCNDIDECATNNGGCSKAPLATCTNKPGAAVSCACPTGDPGDGKTCKRFVWPSDAEPVTDFVTGLVWVRRLATSGGPPAGTYTWAEANDYCAMLSLSGAGWRLPTLEELESLVDKSVTTGAKLDQLAFPATPSESFWTSKVLDPPTSVNAYWYVSFNTGVSAASPGDATQKLYARCVRPAAQPAAAAAQ